MTSDSPFDPSSHASTVAAALERISQSVKPRHFQVFELYSRRKWPLLRVSRELGMDPISVFMISHRIAKMFEAEVSRLRANGR